MGRKVHPIGFRLGIIKEWDSKWYAEGKEYVENLLGDIEIRETIREYLGRAGISRIEIQRFPKRILVRINTAKPGIVIGRKGSTINALKEKLEEITGVTGNALRLDVAEIDNPDLDARVLAENIAEQIERRVSYRRAMSRVAQRAIRAGAEGVKVACKGRLYGSEMGRRDWLMEGRVPLHTLRADIDFAREEAETAYGRIGIKVWVNRGEVLPGPLGDDTARGYGE
ncbi:30S ribosomal protein S3 [bacterium]|nr:30S ribosomal protein S3 [bacterium]